MSREDWRHAKELIAILEEASQEVPEELRGMAERFAKRMADGPRRGEQAERRRRAARARRSIGGAVETSPQVRSVRGFVPDRLIWLRLTIFMFEL